MKKIILFKTMTIIKARKSLSNVKIILKYINFYKIFIKVYKSLESGINPWIYNSQGAGKEIAS